MGFAQRVRTETRFAVEPQFALFAGPVFGALFSPRILGPEPSFFQESVILTLKMNLSGWVLPQRVRIDAILAPGTYF